MPVLVADTSGLVSLGISTAGNPQPLELTLDTYDVHVPTVVVDELEDIAAYDDTHADSAQRVLDNADRLGDQSVDLDSEFPLDDGENAAVTLANETDAALLLCDEFNHLGLIHASLANTRLVTTPTLLAVLVQTTTLDTARARTILDDISAARSWQTNTYVQRAKTMLDNA